MPTTHTLKMSAARTNETEQEKLDRLIPFAAHEDEDMDYDDCFEALREIVMMDMPTVAALVSADDLDRLALGCESWNWHVLFGGFQGMAKIKRMLEQ